MITSPPLIPPINLVCRWSQRAELHPLSWCDELLSETDASGLETCETPGDTRADKQNHHRTNTTALQ